MTDTSESAIYSFIRVMTRRLVDKGVFSDKEMTELLDAWFGEVMELGQEMQEAGSDDDAFDVLQAIQSMTAEFTPK